MTFFPQQMIQVPDLWIVYYFVSAHLDYQVQIDFTWPEQHFMILWCCATIYLSGVMATFPSS